MPRIILVMRRRLRGCRLRQRPKNQAVIPTSSYRTAPLQWCQHPPTEAPELLPMGKSSFSPLKIPGWEGSLLKNAAAVEEPLGIRGGRGWWIIPGRTKDAQGCSSSLCTAGKISTKHGYTQFPDFSRKDSGYPYGKLNWDCGHKQFSSPVKSKTRSEWPLV